ncbi:hypothetical protein RHABOEDO_000526 [Candidatus Rhabdochlamydia oedothoracis]|uniref:Uncharacterized protein n=1 Tax=Candidatus Rhabdochlamydia oedothoracis TaxID=2720720 RepID=A0ABX8UZI1_9BACT|nr:hypothetical protein [Candidatus Rhabdochlamydia oedothoracis]QYF48378.1 hypothetical protein RHABOEDO_000526 [Candidatus Rhabdochlamydia oedothoracis]
MLYTISYGFFIASVKLIPNKKPKLIPGKVNEEAKELFSQELQNLEKELVQTDQLLYLDGVHPQHNSKPSYGWYEKGSKAILLTNTGRKRININGALDVKRLEPV